MRSCATLLVELVLLTKQCKSNVQFFFCLFDYSIAFFTTIVIRVGLAELKWIDGDSSRKNEY